MTTPAVTERGRLTALRAAWLFDATVGMVPVPGLMPPPEVRARLPLIVANLVHRIRAVYARGTAVPDAGVSPRPGGR